MVRRYIYGLGVDEPVALYLGSGTTTRRFYLLDPHGSVAGLTTDAGALQERHSYAPFGRPDDWVAGATGNPLRYAARPYDAELGLTDNRARVYSPSLGRFLQPDPIGYGDGMNLYAYAGNDPVNFADPSGMAAEAIKQSAMDFGYSHLGLVDPNTNTAFVDNNVAATVHYFLGTAKMLF